MSKRKLIPVLIPAVILATSTLMSFALTGAYAHPTETAAKPAANASAAQPPAPAMPDIPGITTPDPKPNSCVDCHKNYPGQFDGRLTTAIKSWATKVEPEILAKAQKTMPPGVKLQGKHPDVSGIVKVIPNDCLMCHSGKSDKVPQFRKLVHLIHLTGGKDNHFVAMFGGKCTLCHKLDQNTGTWGFGSGPAEWP